MNRGRFVIGTIIGAAAGVVAGVLSAPKSGKETREDIKIKAAELREEAVRRAEAAKSSKKPIESLKDSAENIVHRGKDAVKSKADKK